MTTIQEHLLKTMMDDFAAAYEAFLRSEKLNDKPIFKSSFYAAIMAIVTGNPLPSPEMQGQLEERIIEVWSGALDDYQEKIELIVLEIGKIRELSQQP